MCAERMKIIYVVDDEPIISRTLAAILSQAGYQAFAFDMPQQAIDEALTVPPDLLISDIVMPSMSGIELASLFQSLYPRCRILLFSGQANNADLLRTRESSYEFEVLAKPIHPKVLLERLVALS